MARTIEMARSKKTGTSTAPAEEKQGDDASMSSNKSQTDGSEDAVDMEFPADWDPKSDKYVTAEMMVLSLGWPKESAIAAVRQGVTSWRVMARLDPAKVKELCATIRKPGKKDSGIEVPYMAEVNFELACGLCKHFIRISRKPDLDNDFEEEDLEAWRVQAEKEEKWPFRIGEDTNHPKIVKLLQEDPHKAFRQLGTYLEKLRGPNGVPMACIIRDSLIVLRGDEDETEYPTMDDEMIERFPLLPSNYDVTKDDEALTKDGLYSSQGALLNLLFWNLLHTMLGNSPLWTHAKSTTKSKNGRLAYFQIKKIALGEQWVTHRIQHIESELEKCKYKGETNTWDLAKYCERMVALYTMSDELVPYGYHGFDPKTRVDKLVTGIQHEAYGPVKVFIRETNCTDLAEAISKFQNHLLDNPSLQVKKGVGISGVESTGKRGGRRGSGKRGRGRISYTPLEGTDGQVKAGLMDKWFRGPTAKGFIPSHIYKQMSEQERQVIWKIRKELEAAKKGDDATAGTTISSLSHDTVAKLQDDVRKLMAIDKKNARRMEENSDDDSLFSGEDDDARSKGSKRSKSNSGSKQRPPGCRGRQH